MWCYPKKLTNNYSLPKKPTKETLDFFTNVNRRALLVSGEIESLKGCTNDIIEYAVILSKIYKYKEIRILQSELSEKLYGNFTSLALNQLEGGTIVQIIRLSKKSLIDGFKWLLSKSQIDQHPDFSVYSTQDEKINQNNIFNSYQASELVFVYSGNTTLNDEEFTVDFEISSQNNINGLEEINHPKFYISENEQVSFTEMEYILTTNVQQSPTNITCFLDCNHGYLFLSKYTQNKSVLINPNNNINLRHQRIVTMPTIQNINEVSEIENVQNNNQIYCHIDDSRDFNYFDPNISVIIFASCSQSQKSQELTVCSNNGLNLSIIYRRLFSYCFHSLIRQFLITKTINFNNYFYQYVNKSILQDIPDFTIEHIIQQITLNMKSIINNNNLKSQSPLLITSPNVVPKQHRLFQVCIDVHISNSRYTTNTEAKITNDFFGGHVQNKPIFPLPYDNYNNYLNHLPKQNHSMLRSNINNRRVYALNQTNYLQDLTLMQEINQLKTELDYIKRSMNPEVNSLYPSYSTENKFNNYSQSLYNNNIVFKKSVKSSNSHFRTLTSK